MDIFTPVTITGERPTPFGWYHLVWIFIMIAACAVLCLAFAKRRSARLDDRVVFIIGSVLLLSEIYKQIFYYKIDGEYNWSAFPFQLCSLPMYAAVVAPILRRGKVKDALYKFIGFSATLSGLVVMLMPESCFRTDYISMLIHTMLWHVSLVLMGVYVTVAKGYCSDQKSYLSDLLPAFSIFMIAIVLAVGMNVAGYKYYFGTDKNATGYPFAMMYLSPYYGAPFDWVNSLKDAVPYPVYLAGYIALAWGLCTLYFFVVCGLRRLAVKKTS